MTLLNANGKKREDKVAVLTLPADHWNSMPPQAQMLFAMQQLLGFMASDFFQTMEGIEIRVLDPLNIAATKTVLQIGKKAS